MFEQLLNYKHIGPELREKNEIFRYRAGDGRAGRHAIADRAVAGGWLLRAKARSSLW